LALRPDYQPATSLSRGNSELSPIIFRARSYLPLSILQHERVHHQSFLNLTNLFRPASVEPGPKLASSNQIRMIIVLNSTSRNGTTATEDPGSVAINHVPNQGDQFDIHLQFSGLDSEQVSDLRSLCNQFDNVKIQDDDDGLDVDMTQVDASGFIDS
ncbi:hypothetical protein KCU67_g4917, partial [Aureobasidium melanogenum]